MSWWVLKHVDDEGPALIGTIMTEREIEYSLASVGNGDPLPTAENVSGLIVLGGPMDAWGDVAHPHVRKERELIAECLRREIPVLGVCLGAQLLAASQGCAVYRGPVAELGSGEVTAAAAGVSLLGAGAVPVVQWHTDTFDLPEGAELLASSNLYRNQAFRLGSGLGLQFHVELTPAERPMLEAHMPAGTAPDAKFLTRAAEHGRKIIEKFFDEVT
ncbi:glutamine amidotransferase [Rhodococcus sp. AW25M09]|uniref:type 1 glutamine amidotransferase n=1 Tax=Rhodococcus sp. AW25M09 TaxID=1268303 RepID=UPI0002ABFCC4|nr:type 1 glutamine amidotransferase [Rhodococcus sp. AW25M09]CCQ15258.1 glutamine amidotransferase [Rhodococcus sp. AW25M09]